MHGKLRCCGNTHDIPEPDAIDAALLERYRHSSNRGGRSRPAVRARVLPGRRIARTAAAAPRAHSTPRGRRRINRDLTGAFGTFGVRPALLIVPRWLIPARPQMAATSPRTGIAGGGAALRGGCAKKCLRLPQRPGFGAPAPAAASRGARSLKPCPAKQEAVSTANCQPGAVQSSNSRKMRRLLWASPVRQPATQIRCRRARLLRIEVSRAEAGPAAAGPLLRKTPLMAAVTQGISARCLDRRTSRGSMAWAARRPDATAEGQVRSWRCGSRRRSGCDRQNRQHALAAGESISVHRNCAAARRRGRALKHQPGCAGARQLPGLSTGALGIRYIEDDRSQGDS